MRSCEYRKTDVNVGERASKRTTARAKMTERRLVCVPVGDEESLRNARWVARRVPPASEVWDPLDRWHERFRVQWDRPEHINVLELRTAVMALRHCARSRHCWDTRVLCFTDSLVTLGVLTKGRSSSRALLGLARSAAAMQLVLGLRPYWRHIETHRNHADGPSRGFPIGHAPAWAADAGTWNSRTRRSRTLRAAAGNPVLPG